MEAKAVVQDTTPNGDQVLMGSAANEESLASDPRGPVNAARSAHLLYRRLVEMFPNSPLAPEAAWRAADILWQIQKADFSSLPSAKERDPYMRDQMDEDDLKKVVKYYPHTRWADLADYDLIDNKLCGDWQGATKCPEKESDIYEKYAAEHPDAPRTAQALYEAVYRQAVLTDMFGADGSDKKQDEAHNHARELVARLRDKFPQSDFTWRAAALVYKLDQGIPVYGIERQ
jgi:outer membrane protein assembly factor BamD (BamD/ComL family)